MKQGLIHIYCGDGKGKTSAAVGLAVRAAGTGMRVLVVRFMKNEHSGEIKALEYIPGIELIHPEKTFGFMKYLSEEEKAEFYRISEALWDRTEKAVQEKSYDVLVVDEFMAAYGYGLIPREKAVRFLKNKPEGLEVVLTGRNPAEEILELADYVSEIRKEKHPFDRGIPARKGIEY